MRPTLRYCGEDRFEYPKDTRLHAGSHTNSTQPQAQLEVCPKGLDRVRGFIELQYHFHRTCMVAELVYRARICSYLNTII